MKWFCSLALLVAFSWAPLALADTKPDQKDKPKPPAPMSESARMEILRGLSAERLYIRRIFPRGKVGLTLSATGQLKPDQRELANLVAQHGVAAKPGDVAIITRIRFEGRSIVFEINGGPKKPRSWWSHLSVGMGGAMTPVAPSNSGDNPLGSYVTLEFPRYVPELSVREVKSLLQPVFDFDSHSSAETYADSLPPKLRDAIKAHTVLVGMDRDMVTAALGKPQNKVREKDEQGVEYEEWIYGTPPEDVQFVRFVGEQVVRLEIMKVDGAKTVRTEREVELPSQGGQAGGQAASPAQTPQAPPTLRRPGEVAPDAGRQQPTGGPVLTDPNTPAPSTPPGSSVPSPPPPGGPN